MYQETELVLGNAKCTLLMHDRSAVAMASYTHVHPNYELFYVWQGGVEILANEQTYFVGPGQAVLIAPTFYHQTRIQPGTEKFSVYFSLEPLSRRRIKDDVYVALARALSGISIMVLDSAPELGRIVSELRQIQTKDCFCRKERLQAELTKLILAVYDVMTLHIRQRQEYENKPAGNLLYRYEMDAVLSKNYMRDIGLDYLAEYFHLSPKRVSVLVKSLYGKTFRQVKAEMRVAVAKQLLKESDLTVAEIGEQVGYHSTRGFLAAFMDLTGRTPSQYRAEKRRKA